jgi:hypothetical protein
VVKAGSYRNAYIIHQYSLQTTVRENPVSRKKRGGDEKK